MVSESTVAAYWGISLALGLVVIIVVAILLSILRNTVRQIEGDVAEIWRVGKLIANNTVHIPLLVQTNQIAAQIVEASDGIAAATARLQRLIAHK